MREEISLKQDMGTTKPFGGLHIISIENFCQIGHVKDTYVFKDDDKNYGPFPANLWKTHFHMSFLTETMQQHFMKC